MHTQMTWCPTFGLHYCLCSFHCRLSCFTALTCLHCMLADAAKETRDSWARGRPSKCPYFSDSAPLGTVDRESAETKWSAIVSSPNFRLGATAIWLMTSRTQRPTLSLQWMIVNRRGVSTGIIWSPSKKVPGDGEFVTDFARLVHSWGGAHRHFLEMAWIMKDLAISFFHYKSSRYYKIYSWSRRHSMTTCFLFTGSLLDCTKPGATIEPFTSSKSVHLFLRTFYRELDQPVSTLRSFKTW